MFNQKKIKINFFSAKTKKADIALKNLKKKYKNYPMNKVYKFPFGPVTCSGFNVSGF